MRRYEPTDEQRRTVRTMAGFGVPHEDIATFLGIDGIRPATAAYRDGAEPALCSYGRSLERR